jgi:hypothetical protein
MDRGDEYMSSGMAQGAANLELIGRERIDDLTAILSVTNPEDVDFVHVVPSDYDARFTWDYDKGARPQVNRLYERAKSSQWDGAKDLPWDTDVDQERVVVSTSMRNGGLHGGRELAGTLLDHWSEKDWIRFRIEQQNWQLSQFLHGEQGALLCTARIVETVPWIDAKYFAATQVMDEARHVEVFSRYLDTKLSGHYDVNPHLRLLLDDIISDDRWDVTYLGMQIMVEGLALASFGFMHTATTEPLLKQLLRYVMADEARHVAFGVLSLQEYYAGLSQAELKERQEFAFEAAIRMRDRLFMTEVWGRMGVPMRSALELVIQAPNRRQFQARLFSKIVPNCKKLGLLDAGDGWLRDRFTEMGIIGFEDLEDTASTYDLVGLPPRGQPVAAEAS